MKLVVISPEGYEPREHAVMAEFFAAGLERYHVRKPQWQDHVLRNFIRLVPEKWHARLVLHQGHALTEEFACGGVHFRDSERAGEIVWQARARFCSRSCHSLASLEAALGRFDSVFFSPVFPSISKMDYVPSVDLGTVATLLRNRTPAQRRTAVVALGGISPDNAARCAELGFDGVAVLGALWQAARPLKIFEQLQQALSVHAA